MSLAGLEIFKSLHLIIAQKRLIGRSSGVLGGLQSFGTDSTRLRLYQAIVLPE